MSTTTPAKTSAVSPSPTTLRVQGMDCGGCERKVEAALNRLNHVEHVSASSVTGSVRLTAPPGKTLPHSDIESTITALGYQVIDESVNTTESEKSSSWWQSPKGRLVIVSGVLLALAWGLKFAWPTLGWLLSGASLSGATL